jgi:hypothetical protein
MNRNTLLTIAVLGVVAYFVFRKPKEAKEIGQSPEDAGSKKVVKGVDAGTKADTTATLKARGIKPPKKRRVLVADIKVPKNPVIIPATNLIPSVYGRGIGQPMPTYVSANGQGFFNRSGYCSENIENACKCLTTDKQKFKLDIPNID